MNWTLADSKVREKFRIPYTIKAMIVNVVNPFRSMGEPRQTEKAVKAMDFIVSVAVWVDAPALFADVVLPDVPPLERLVPWQYSRLYQIGIEGVMLRQPVVRAPVQHQEYD